jgi:hypothetical protein
MNSHKTVESFRIDTVKEHALPNHIDGLPFSGEELRSLLENCPAILVSPDITQDSIPFNPIASDAVDDYHLRQPSAMHRRSFEIVVPDQMQPWTDEFGNIYNALTLKGNNFSNPSIMEHPTASEGYIAYGLQESSIIGRVLKASEVLRARNISTEYTIGLAEPKQYPWPLIDSQTDAHEMISLKEYKRRIIDDYWRSLDDDKRTPEALADLYKKFQDMTFYVSLRATDTAYRLFDMSNESTRQSTFNFINQQQLMSDNSEPLNAANPKDMHRYLEQVFSPRVGRNFARLHIDMSHRFAHGYNMSALGSIVDLDSIHGEPLGFGDADVSDLDRAQDIADVIAAIDAMEHLNISNDHTAEAIYKFLDSYISETIALKPDLTSALLHLEQVFGELANDIRQRNVSLGIHNPTMILEYVNEYLYTLITEVVPSDQIVELETRAGLCIHDVIGDDKTDARIDQDFNESAEKYISESVDEYANEITSAATDGDVYDILSDLTQTFTKPSSYMGSLMIDQVLESYHAEIERRFGEIDIDQAQLSEQHPLSRLLCATVSRRVLRHYNDDLRLFATAKVGVLLPTLEDELLKASTFTVTDSILDGYSSFANMGLNESHLWRCTEDVDLSDIIEFLDESNVEFELEPLVMHDIINRTVTIPAYRENVRVDEIISNLTLDGWSHSRVDGQPVLNISYAEHPSYVLIKEVVDDTQQRIRLQLPIEAVELIKSGARTLKQLLPSYEQPMLF